MIQLFEIKEEYISQLNDGDLRELVGKLCTAEIETQNLPTSGITYGGAQEAPDGGLDVSVGVTNDLPAPDYIPCKRTGIQVKKHSMGKSACTKEMQNSTGDIKPIIQELADAGGAYIIVSGTDSCSDKMLKERKLGMEEAVEDIQNKDCLTLDFYDRKRLLTWLEKYPSVILWVRTQLGIPVSSWKPFGHWSYKEQNHFLIDEQPCITNSDNPNNKLTILEGIDAIRAQLTQSSKAIRLVGLSGVGKTRFAQALFEDNVGNNALLQSEVIYADLGDAITPSAPEAINYLIAQQKPAIVVLDNCPPDIHRQLKKKLDESNSLVKLLTIEYDISDDQPEETTVFRLEPAGKERIEQLLKARYAGHTATNIEVIADLSEGNARLALALASRVSATESLSSFSDDELFSRLFEQRKGKNDNLQATAELLSLVYSFNTTKAHFNDELSVLAQIADSKRSTLFRHRATLLERELAQKRGDWCAILPHALANRLAKQALAHIALDEINAELLKPENKRLFFSCAHRIGYLHDSEQAIELASSWLEPNAPLGDFANFNDDQLKAVAFIAPLISEKILIKIERLADIVHIAKFQKLLYHIAYDEQLFKRSVTLLLRIAEAIVDNSPENQYLKQLFSPFLSGTKAYPSQRLEIIKKLINNNQLIGLKLLETALQTSGFISMLPYDFGARDRGFGWEPKTQAELDDWYYDHIQLLDSALSSIDDTFYAEAKRIFATHFRALWCDTHRFTELESIVLKYFSNGDCCELWVEIKNTLTFDGKRHDEALLHRLQHLEAVTKPKGLINEIKAFVLRSTHEQPFERLNESNASKDRAKIHQQTLGLGKQVGNHLAILDELGESLWNKYTDTLSPFGEGLAEGSINATETFDKLIKSIEKSSLDSVATPLLSGFITKIYEQSETQAQAMLACVLKEPKLSNSYIDLLSDKPFTPWKKEQILALIKAKKVKAGYVSNLSCGGRHEVYRDDELAELLQATNQLDKGVLSTVQVLNMRFFDVVENYIPSDRLQQLAQDTIQQAIQNHELENIQFYDIEETLKYCFTQSAEKSIKELISVIKQAKCTQKYYHFSETEKSLIEWLLQHFSHITLDAFYDGKDFNLVGILSFNRVTLNHVNGQELLQWCNDDRQKLLAVAKYIDFFPRQQDGFLEENNVDTPTLNPFAFDLLDSINNKQGIIEIVYHNATTIQSWVGSLANILEQRKQAFSELLSYPSEDIQALVKEKISLFQSEIERRVHEENEIFSDNSTQRFE